jgi:hypothetical protein
LRRTERAAGALALVLGLLHLWLAPHTGTDLAAQLARASFARDAPLTPVDLSWYGGSHPFSYSVLAPWVMALLGVGLTGLLAAVAGSLLLARLLRDSARPLLASLTGAVFVVANVVSGRVTFGLGLVAALAALLALPSRRRTAVFAVLAALLSPVAAAFLGLVAAVLVLHRRPGGWTLGLSATVPVLALSALFAGGGVQPFGGSSAPPAVVVAVMLAVLTASALVRTGALLWGAGVLVLVNHDDPFGSNVLRLGLLLAATVLLATARRRPVLVLVAFVGFLSWQIGPPRGDLAAPEGPPTSALVAELQRVGAHRVEVVAPRDHRESADVAEHVPLARGWSRQTDYQRNPLFYSGELTGPAYLDWLRDNAVDHVAVPVDAVLDFGSTREGELLAAPVPGLQEVWRSPDWVVLAVADPTPLVAAPASVVASGRTSVTVRSDRVADVVLHVRWSRWLTVASGPACLERYGDEVRLRISTPGTVVVGSALRPRGHC